MPAPRLCARCGWMLPHGPEVCRHPKGPLPQSHKGAGRLQDLAFDALLGIVGKRLTYQTTSAR